MKLSGRLWLILIAVAAVAVFVLFIFLRQPQSSPVSSQAGNTAAKPASAKKTIVFSFGGNDSGSTNQSMIREFEKTHPDFKVKVQQLPNSTDYQKNYYKRALYSGDSSIDVFFSDIIWTAEFASSGWALPLDQYFSSSETGGFLDNALESCTYDGKLYAVPSRMDIPLLYYRSDIIKTPPKTYKEMTDLANEYQKANGIKYGFVFQGKAYEGLICTALDFIWSNGGDIMKDGKIVIDSPQSIEGLQLLADMVGSGVSSRDVFNFEEEDARIAFQDGNALFMRNWPYAYVQLDSDNSKVKGRFKIAPMPVGPHGSVSRGTLGGWNFMINKNTKNLDAAITFVKAMTGHDIEVVASVNGGFLPTRKDTYNDPKVEKAVPWIKGLEDSLRNAKPRPVSPLYSMASNSMQENFSNCIQGKISAAAAIENIQKDMERTFNTNK